MYNMTVNELEDVADTVKVAILKSLVRDGKFNAEEAEDWCKQHTVLLKKKSVFQTISNLWKNESEIDGFVIKVVKDA